MAYTTINKSTEHFNTKLFTGNGSAGHAITGVGFQPDWTWIKNRSREPESHVLYDAVRGATKRIQSNLTSAESTKTNGLTAFGSDGFTVGDAGQNNYSGDNIVSWNWKANGQGSSNTDGSINTTYTSANTTAGFSISQYTGTGANATVGHGLGVAPKMYICKSLSGARSWAVYHQSMGNTKALFLNSTDAQDTDNPYWNATSPTNSTVSLGHRSEMNHSGENFIMYCFADVQGYSKFGSYTGNGNADGSFIYTGFRPAFMMVKRTDAAQPWVMTDSTRSTYNITSHFLSAESTDAEASFTYFDILSNGFKCRNSSNYVNESNGTYIYMAFAEAPLVGTNGVTAKAR